MGLSLSTFQYAASASGPTVVTVTIPAGAAVGVIVLMDGDGGLGYFQGALSDTVNTYTASGGSNSGGAALYCDSFYSLNVGAATTVTYTPSASYSGHLYNVTVDVWVWTVSGGTATFGSQSSLGQSAPGTGTDAITSNAVTCAAGSVVMGGNRDNGAGVVSIGTGFTLDVSEDAVYTAEHGAFSSNHAATFTTSVGTDTPILSQAISFGFNSSGVPVAWWV
jgi:hypothetical protein